MDELTDELVEVLAPITPRGGAVPMMSTVVGREVDGTELDAAYWAANLRRPVMFADALSALLDAGVTHVVEISPHPVLTPAVEQLAAGRETPVAVLSSLRREEGALVDFTRALGRAYTAGLALFGTLLARPGAAVPPYPWQRSRFWLPEAPRRSAGPGGLTFAFTPAATEQGVHEGRTELSLHDLPWLRDHQVYDAVVLPGAAMLALAVAAARVRTGENPEALHSVRFRSDLTLTDEPVRVGALWREDGPGLGGLHAHLAAPGRGHLDPARHRPGGRGRPGAAGPGPTARGRPGGGGGGLLRRVRGPRAELRARLPRRDRAARYPATGRAGPYGCPTPAWPGCAPVSCTRRCGTPRSRSPRPAAGRRHRRPHGGGPRRPRRRPGRDRDRGDGARAAHRRRHLRPRSATTRRAGSVLGMTGLRFQTIAAEEEQPVDPARLHRLEFRTADEALTATRTGHWVLYDAAGTGGELAAALTAGGATATVLPPGPDAALRLREGDGPDGLVFLAPGAHRGLDVQRAGLLDLAEVVRAATAPPVPPRTVVVTEGAQGVSADESPDPGARAVLGLRPGTAPRAPRTGRVAGRRRAAAGDWAGPLTALLLSADAEDQTVLRGDRRLVGRLVRGEEEDPDTARLPWAGAAQPFRLRLDASACGSGWSSVRWPAARWPRAGSRWRSRRLRSTSST